MQTQLGNAKCSNSGEYNNIVSVTEDGKVLLVKSSVELKKKDTISIWSKHSPTNPKKSKNTMGKSGNTIPK